MPSEIGECSVIHVRLDKIGVLSQNVLRRRFCSLYPLFYLLLFPPSRPLCSESDC